jgi:crossover junction endodeoxyribonuclease RusA
MNLSQGVLTLYALRFTILGMVVKFGVHYTHYPYKIPTLKVKPIVTSEQVCYNMAMAEIQRVRFTLPLPPSINSQYTQIGKIRVLSKEHKSFKKQVDRRLHRLRVDEVITDSFIELLKAGWIGLFLDFYFETPLRRDLDGGLKITQDAILATLGINDNRVVDVHLVKRIAPTNPRVEVELEAIPEWQFDEEYEYREG